MKLRFLGTAAYEGVPALFCNCDVCKRSALAGGKNIRTRTQAIVNDDLLIDFPPDTFLHFLRFRDDFENIRNVLITHSHSDHLYPDDIEALRGCYSHGWLRPWHFFAGESGTRVISRILSATKPEEADVTELHAFEEKIIGNYRVLPLPANHAQGTAPFIYRITDGEKSMLYAHDTGLPEEAVYEALAAGGHLDLISFDGTCGLQDRIGGGHLTLKAIAVLLDRLKELGVIDDRTVKVMNHFSHHAGATYDEMTEICRPLGILVSYDGMQVGF